MEAHAKTSRLAIASLGVISMWYSAWLISVSYVYFTKHYTGQRWDLIPVMGICWCGWYPFSVAATVLGILALLRIQSSGRQLTGWRMAVTAIALSQVSVVVGIVGPYLPNYLP